MGDMVDDLLNLSRVARKELNLQVTGLSSLVDEVLKDLKPETKDREIEWKIAGLPFVECDPVLVKQVFVNLLSNAVKFTRTRPHAVIEVDQTNVDGQTVTYVRDNGVGFSMKYSDKLFGVFQRLHRQEDFEGTGVGLATVQRIVQKHGGRIWAEAELNTGATFYFTLGTSASCRRQPMEVQRDVRRSRNSPGRRQSEGRGADSPCAAKGKSCATAFTSLATARKPSTSCSAGEPIATVPLITRRNSWCLT